MTIHYLGHKLKRLDILRHGRSGWRVESTGREFRYLREAKGAVAATVFPYPHVGGPPIGRRAS